MRSRQCYSGSMPKRLAAAVVALAVAACAPMRGVEPVPISAADFRPAQIRQPALVVRLAFGGQVSDREREVLPAEYEGALLEGLNTRAVLAKDVQVVAGRDAKLDARAALDRARALGADHAIVVDVRVTAGGALFFPESPPPLSAPAARLSPTGPGPGAGDGAPPAPDPGRRGGPGPPLY